MITITNLETETIVLILLCLMSYMANMIEQVKNDDINVTLYDWWFNAWTGVIGGVVAYYIALSWMNIGVKMVLSIIISLSAPRIIRFINTPTYQEAMAEGIGKGLINLVKLLFNGKNVNNGESN